MGDAQPVDEPFGLLKMANGFPHTPEPGKISAAEPAQAVDRFSIELGTARPTSRRLPAPNRNPRRRATPRCSQRTDISPGRRGPAFARGPGPVSGFVVREAGRTPPAGMKSSRRTLSVTNHGL